MSLFGKNKHKDRQPIVDASHSTQETTPPRTSFAHEVLSRVQAAQTAQVALIKEAVERGVPEEELPQLVADALTAKEIPRVLRGPGDRHGGATLIMLDGEVPASAINVKCWTRDGSMGARVDLQPLPPDAPESDLFHIERTDRLPVTDNYKGIANTDPAVLAQIDAHFPAAK